MSASMRCLIVAAVLVAIGLLNVVIEAAAGFFGSHLWGVFPIVALCGVAIYLVVNALASEDA